MKLIDSPITQNGHNKYLLELRELAKKNRNNPTKAESILWHQVLKKKQTGYKFLRQKPINQFILDFYSSKLLLDIEVDGDIHNKQQNRDIGRNQILNNIGIKTIRYNNDEIIKKLDKVKENVMLEIKDRQNEL